MRLIDVDKLKKYLGSEPLYSDSINEHTYIIEHIDKMPTVDAIPVEWIKKYMSRCLAIEQDAIGEMVKEWAERIKEE